MLYVLVAGQSYTAPAPRPTPKAVAWAKTASPYAWLYDTEPHDGMHISAVPSDWKWQGEDMFFGKINQNSRFTYLRTIENSLSGADWQIVLNGPFGPIVKMMMNYRVYAQVIHHLLFRQV